jgi:hypothetical protein
VDLVVEAITRAIDVCVFELPFSVHGEPLCLPPMLGQLLLVVSGDLLRGCALAVSNNSHPGGGD